MAFIVDERSGTVQIHDGLVTAITRNAEQRAALAAGYLDAMDLSFGPHGGRPYGLPPLVVLELGALLQIIVWERQGLAEFLSKYIPTMQQAIANFLALVRAASGDSTTSFELFSELVCSVGLDHISWDAEKYLGTNIVLCEVDEEQIIDALANLAWSSRTRSI